jgi:hypothetical protein
MPKYRKKPVIIEAMEYYCLESYLDICNWIDETDNTLSADEVVELRGNTMIINTLEGAMTAKEGDYIIKGVNDEFYPCKPDIFHKTYEKVEEVD